MGLFCEKKAWQHKHKQYQAWHWIQCWLHQTIQTIIVLFFWDLPSSNSKFIILFIYISTLTFWSRCKYSCSMFNVQSAHIHHRQRHSWPAFHSKGRWGRQGTSVTLNVTADDRCHPPSVRFIWLCSSVPWPILHCPWRSQPIQLIAVFLQSDRKQQELFLNIFHQKNFSFINLSSTIPQFTRKLF